MQEHGHIELDGPAEERAELRLIGKAPGKVSSRRQTTAYSKRGTSPARGWKLISPSSYRWGVSGNNATSAPAATSSMAVCPVSTYWTMLGWKPASWQSRSLGLASQIYANDNNDTVPGDSFTGNYCFATLLAPYIAGPRITPEMFQDDQTR